MTQSLEQNVIHSQKKSTCSPEVAAIIEAYVLSKRTELLSQLEAKRKKHAAYNRHQYHCHGKPYKLWDILAAVDETERTQLRLAIWRKRENPGKGATGVLLKRLAKWEYVIDIRRFYRTADGQWQGTKQGVRFGLPLLAPLLRAIQVLQAAYGKKGSMPRRESGWKARMQDQQSGKRESS